MRRLLIGSFVAFATLWAAPLHAEPPRRVVSMNACTDQLAMLIAGEGQLYSVSYLASDPGTSALVEKAKGYAVNHGLAEEIFLMQPDLVLAGTYSTRTTVALLLRLGIDVEDFEPEQSLDDIRANLLRMGMLLGREQRAAELVAEFDRRLAALGQQRFPNVSVATYYANSYTSGSDTLVDAVVKLSGLTNVAARLGLVGTARLPLELLVLARPDLLADGGFRYASPALATENFRHPAYRTLLARMGSVAVPTAYTVCGTPFTAEAASIMQDAARHIEDDGR